MLHMEYWDIYDQNKERTGRIMQKNDWHMKPGDYHLTVLGAIRNADGRYLITRRVRTKAWAAGCWEISGGGVMAGETSTEAVRRELLEETGIDIQAAKGGYQFTYRRDNPDEGDNYFVDVYRFDVDIKADDVRIQREEADAFCFADADEIARIAAEGKFLHYDSVKKIFE